MIARHDKTSFCLCCTEYSLEVVPLPCSDCCMYLHIALGTVKKNTYIPDVTLNLDIFNLHTSYILPENCCQAPWNVLRCERSRFA